MANLGTFIAGRYSATYNSVDIGPTENGFSLKQSLKEELINESDQYGGSLLDFIYRGGDAMLVCDCKEYKAGSITPFWPWGGIGIMSTAAAPIGRRASDVAAATVLTATAATPAAAAPATLTATYSIMSPGFNPELLFNSKLRRVPISLQLLPYISTDVKWFSTT